MTTPRVKVDKMLVKDKKGWPYDNAFIVVRKIESTIENLAESKLGTDGYDETSTYNIKYTCNYWGSKAMQEAGLPSRPLGRFIDIPAVTVYEKNSDGEHVLDDAGNKKPTGEILPARDEWSEEFIVDTEHLQSVQVLNSSMAGIDERNRLVELNITRDFAQEKA